MTSTAVPPPTLTRLPVYARVLDDLVRRGVVTASSVELAAAAGVEPAQLRRDLSHLGSYGKRGVGYDVAELRAHVRGELNLDEAAAAIQQATRRYAKRQMTWFRRETCMQTICLSPDQTPDSVAAAIRALLHV